MFCSIFITYRSENMEHESNFENQKKSLFIICHLFLPKVVSDSFDPNIQIVLKERVTTICSYQTNHQVVSTWTI